MLNNAIHYNTVYDETYFWRVKMLVDSPMALMRRARSEGMLVERYWA